MNRIQSISALVLAFGMVGWSFPVDLTALRTASEAVDASAQDALAQRDADPVLDRDAIVAGVQARYDEITDFQATFTQEATTVTTGAASTGSGNVYFLRPGHMLWDYADGRRLVLEGENLHMIDRNERQYYSSPIGDSELPTAMRFLLGEGDLASDFEITLLPETTDRRAMLDLVPRTASGDYARLVFAIDLSTFNIVETTIVGVVGDTNTIQFSEIRTNTGMTETSFAFTPPNGYTEISVPE